MPRRVGDDELALVGREIAVGHVNGDALFALGLQAVQQEGVVDVVARIAHALAIALQGVQLVFVNLLAIEQQAADKSRLAIVHASSGQEA